MFNLMILIGILVNLIVVEKNKLISLFPIVSILIFTVLIIKFTKIAFGITDVNSDEEWFYNIYNRGCLIFIIITFLIKVFN